MIEFNLACDRRDIARAWKLRGEIEELLLIPCEGFTQPEYEADLRKPINQYYVGHKRLVIIDQRLWQLRHPEPPNSGWSRDLDS